MQVAAVSIGDGVGVTLCNTDGRSSWRFSSWHRNSIQITAVAPTPADCAREFATIEEAAEYFRERYGERLRTS